jgi:hypothetical protein
MIAFLMRQYLSPDEIDISDLPDLLLCQGDFVDVSFIEFLRSQKIQLEIPKI